MLLQCHLCSHSWTETSGSFNATTFCFLIKKFAASATTSAPSPFRLLAQVITETDKMLAHFMAHKISPHRSQSGREWRRIDCHRSLSPPPPPRRTSQLNRKSVPEPPPPHHHPQPAHQKSSSSAAVENLSTTAEQIRSSC